MQPAAVGSPDAVVEERARAASARQARPEGELPGGQRADEPRALAQPDAG